jgi:hypothetical protein
MESIRNCRAWLPKLVIQRTFHYITRLSRKYGKQIIISYGLKTDHPIPSLESNFSDPSTPLFCGAREKF